MKPQVLKATVATDPLETGLDDDVRRTMAGRLCAVLADTLVLMIKTQVCHWNVVGPLFKPIHDLTEEQYTDLFEAADVIAERIRALGFPAPVSFETLLPHTDLAEEKKPRSAGSMVRQLIADHEHIVRRMREHAEIAEQHGDIVSHDMLVQRMNFHEKAIWMLKATVAE